MRKYSQLSCSKIFAYFDQRNLTSKKNLLIFDKNQISLLQYNNKSIKNYGFTVNILRFLSCLNLSKIVTFNYSFDLEFFRAVLLSSNLNKKDTDDRHISNNFFKSIKFYKKIDLVSNILSYAIGIISFVLGETYMFKKEYKV